MVTQIRPEQRSLGYKSRSKNDRTGHQFPILHTNPVCLLSTYHSTMSYSSVLAMLPIAMMLTVASLSTATSSSMSSSIRNFNLIDARSGTFIRSLSDGDRITVPFPFTIAAVPYSRSPVQVVFTSPSYVVSRSVPHILSEDGRTSADLLPGVHRISAYFGEQSDAPLSITVHVRPSGLSWRGPQPSAGVVGMSPPPAINARCSGRPPPVVTDFRLEGPYFFHGSDPSYSASIDYCTRGGQEVRVRLMALKYRRKRSGADGGLKTRVLDSSVTEYFSDVSKFILSRRCGDTLVYIEACVIGSEENQVCATSRMLPLPAPTIDEPRPSFRPPITLDLAPGDKVQVVNRITDDEGGREGFSNDEDQTGPFSVSAIAKGADGYILSDPPLTEGKVVTTTLPTSGTRRGVTLGYNGTTVFLKYGRPGCKKNFGTFEDRYATTVTVSRATSSLVRQDTRTPEFDNPTYPRTAYGSPVTLSVRNAQNRGGGLRADGSTPQLHYQWYVRRMSYAGYPTYAEPISGATGPSLRLQKEECNKMCYSMNYVIGLHEFYVDVCNTYGCRRSQKIVPRIAPPPLGPGEEWHETDCRIRGSSDSCDNARYCMVGPVAKRCPVPQ